ncbi:MAG: FN3 associated domain-containing protein [Patescibacteria group bacterium]|nr:FN3 associated domain-containing protein [Patescibacteria group bacterium]
MRALKNNFFRVFIIFINFFCIYNFVFSAELNMIEKKREFKCASILSGNITLNKNYTCIGNAFTLLSNAVLNCNGYSINGGGTSSGNIGIGINLLNASNVTVKNCKISGFQYGIKLENSNSNNIYFNHFNNTINAYESSSSSNNLWYSINSQAGNFWSDFQNNLGYPNSYFINGDGDGVDNYPNPTVSDPVASQESGIVDYQSFITLSTQTPNAQIRYTLDGFDPNQNSLLYTSSIQIFNTTTTLKAIAYRNNYASSDISIYNYNVLVSENPVASQESGIVDYQSFITLSTQTPNAQIRYTLDGSDPNQNSLLYTNPIQITQSINLKARTYKNGYIPSNVSTYNYVVIVPGSCGSTINENLTLTQDINCSTNIPVAFNIGANNITIDCNGYSINGSSDTNDYGIQINSKNGVIIKNCEINGFQYGINLLNTTSSIFYNNEFNNIINAHEDETSLNNLWDFNNHGNYWYDYDSNSATPLSYIINGPGNGVDNFPKPRKMNLNCGDTINQSVTLLNNITCVEDQWVSLNVNSNHITIDCENHSITGSPGIDDWGINIIGRDNITIRNCNFYALNFPIYHEDGSYNLIENNTFNSTRHGPILRKGSHNIIKNNTILNTEMDGIGIIGYLNDGISSHNNQVINNTVTNCGSDYASIDISYGNNNLIDRNTIIGTGQYDNSLIMINALSSNNIVSNNWGTGGDYGLWITTGSSYNNIFHNYVANSAYVGIYIDSETSFQTIYNNTILNSAQNNAYQEVLANLVDWELDGVGNFWGDHNCIDSDNNGICENPYNFPGDIDYHPLAISPWTNATNTERFMLLERRLK